MLPPLDPAASQPAPPLHFAAQAPHTMAMPATCGAIRPCPGTSKSGCISTCIAAIQFVIRDLCRRSNAAVRCLSHTYRTGVCSDRPCNLARACLKRLLERSSVPVSRVRWQLSAASRCSGSSRRCAAEDTIGKVAETWVRSWFPLRSQRAYKANQSWLNSASWCPALQQRTLLT